MKYLRLAIVSRDKLRALKARVAELEEQAALREAMDAGRRDVRSLASIKGHAKRAEKRAKEEPTGWTAVGGESQPQNTVDTPPAL